MQAQRDTRRQRLLTRDAYLCSDLHMWLREAVAQHFRPRPRARNPRPEFRLALDSFRSFVSASSEREAVYDAEPRAFLEVFLEETQNFLDTEFAKAF